MDSKKRHKGKQSHATGAEYSTDVSSHDVMIKAAFLSQGQVCRTSSVPQILKAPTLKHAHTLVMNSNKGTAVTSSYV